jgi:hypothetical protein
VSGRLRFVWEPSKELSADVRVYASRVRTQALYFNITESVNDTSLPVRVNNAGVNERNMFGTSLKLDYVRPLGTLTSITAYDRFNELLTGDQFNFLPIPESVLFKFFGADQAQHQFLEVNAVSEALQFASPATKRVRWIVGYVSDLDRSFHFHGQCLRPGHRRGARGAAGSLAALQSAVHLPCRLAGQFRLGGVRQRRRQSHGQTGVVDVVALRP